MDQKYFSLIRELFLELQVCPDLGRMISCSVILWSLAVRYSLPPPELYDPEADIYSPVFDLKNLSQYLSVEVDDESQIWSTRKLPSFGNAPGDRVDFEELECSPLLEAIIES